jgi:4-diphosphocytidyl-2-C-methyl-D-erythritol kinase
VILRAYAKVNLYLAVLSKRSDGYHDILSLMHNVSLYDIIEIEESREEYFVCDKKLEWNESNTIYKALRVFEETTGIRAKVGIKLTKRIPMKGGLGGASTDAASVLWYLCDKFSKVDLIMDMAEKVGSDVPFFVNGGCSLVEGKGEKLTSLPTLNIPIRFYFPKKGFSTPEMYEIIDEENLNGQVGDPMLLYEALKQKDLKAALSNTYNSFEEIVKKRDPFLEKKAHEKLFPCDIVAMTGSGSTFYGLDLTSKCIKKENEGFHLSSSPRDVFYE